MPRVSGQQQLSTSTERRDTVRAFGDPEVLQSSSSASLPPKINSREILELKRREEEHAERIKALRAQLAPPVNGGLSLGPHREQARGQLEQQERALAQLQSIRFQRM